MMRLCCSILLLCLFANAENIALYKESGESVTLECSSAGCTSSTEEYAGMYLYHDFKVQEEVLYYHSGPGSTDNITPRQRYKNKIQTDGPLKNHTIKISNLTVDDAGSYSCVYIRIPRGDDRCNIYTLVVRGVPCAPADEKSLPLVLIIIATCIISTLVTLSFILLILPKAKQWTSSRRRTSRASQVSNDYVYEVMTKNGLRPLAAPENSQPSPNDFA